MSAATPQEVREQIVHGFCDQSPEALAGISTLRGLAGTLFYALPELGTGVNPNWAAIGYPGPISAAARPRAPAAGPAPGRVPTRRSRPTSASSGSGAGGGVIAGELAAAGKSVVVLEIGDYSTTPTSTGSSSPPTSAST